MKACCYLSHCSTFICFSLKMREPVSIQIHLLKHIHLLVKWKVSLKEMYICSLQQCREARKLYCSSNGLMSLMQNTLCFLKNALLSKGYVKHWQYISYFTHGSDRFGLQYIIFLQVKYCLSVNSSWVFKTKTKFSLASNSAIVGVYMSKNENDIGNYFHNNKEHQKLVKISISGNLYQKKNYCALI